jgi:hypothetical protein
MLFCWQAKKTTTEKQKALELAVGLIEKQFGKGAIMKLAPMLPYPCRGDPYRGVVS